MNYDSQLSQGGLDIVAGPPYVLSFTASATAPRSLNVAFSSGEPAYTWLGGGTVYLTTTLQAFSVTVVPTASVTGGGLQFNVGKSLVGLTIDKVSLVRKAVSGVAGADPAGNGLHLVRRGKALSWSLSLETDQGTRTARVPSRR